MNQAQGAIEAARAAGADRFAAAELAAAVDALKRSNEAAAGNDYRQALNHALDSFERAQNAAKLAVEGRANARGEAERAVAQVATLLATAETQIKASPLPARSLTAPQQTIDAAAKSPARSARSAAAKEDYLAVAPALDGIAAGLQAALTQIDEPAAAGAGAPQALGRLPCDRSYRDHRLPDCVSRFLIGQNSTGPSVITVATMTTKATRSSSTPWRIIWPIGHEPRTVDDGVGRRRHRHHEAHAGAERGAQRRLDGPDAGRLATPRSRSGRSCSPTRCSTPSPTPRSPRR